MKCLCTESLNVINGNMAVIMTQLHLFFVFNSWKGSYVFVVSGVILMVFTPSMTRATSWLVTLAVTLASWLSFVSDYLGE